MQKLLWLLIGMSLITSCGDSETGGDTGTPSGVGSVVEGVAAAGAPLIGQVSLVDATGTPADGSPKVLNPDGSFFFDVAGRTPPFVLRAAGTPIDEENPVPVTLFSAAASPGIANINPMTNVIVAAAAGTNNPAEVFQNPAEFADRLTATSLMAAASSLQTMLQPLLVRFEATGINPLTDPFRADRTGLDAVFDAVRLPIDNAAGTVSVVDRSGTVFGSSALANLGSSSLTSVPLPRVTGVRALAGNGQVTVSWNQVPGATAFNIYFAAAPNVTRSTGTLIANVTSPRVISGLANGITFSFVVTAVVGGIETPESATVRATPTPTPLAANIPTNVTAIPGNGQVTLSWNAVPGATSYNIYFSTLSGVTRTTGSRTTTPNTAAVISGLTNGVTHFFVVTAVTAAGESAESQQVSATPIFSAATVPTPAIPPIGSPTPTVTPTVPTVTPLPDVTPAVPPATAPLPPTSPTVPIIEPTSPISPSLPQTATTPTTTTIPSLQNGSTSPTLSAF